MKKIILALLFLVFVSFSVSAQGFYFDIGGSFGVSWLKIDKEKPEPGMGINLGLKAGYGPFGNIPI